MRKGIDVIGLPVYTRSQGKEQEAVRDLIFDHQNNRILALVLDEGGWLRSARVVRWADVRSIGPDAVIIPSEDVIVPAEETNEVHDVLDEGNVLKGTQILTTDGKDLGAMTDVYFNEETGTLVGYEVSGGLFADATTGRSFVPAPLTLTIGEDAAFVPPATALLMEEQTGGLQGAVESVGQKVQETAEGAVQSAQDTAQNAGQKVQETAQATAETVSQKVEEAHQAAREKAFELSTKSEEVMRDTREKMEQASESAGEHWQKTKETVQQKAGELSEKAKIQAQDIKAATSERLGKADSEIRDHADRISGQVSEAAETGVARAAVGMARGRRARHSVRLESGAYLVVVGQIVTDSVIELARLLNRESDLLNAIGLNTQEAARLKSAEAASDLQEKVVHGTQAAVEMAQETAGAAKEMLASLRDDSSR